MKKLFLLGAMVCVLGMMISCDMSEQGKMNGKVKDEFKNWAKNNIGDDWKIDSIVYDTAGTCSTYVTVSTALRELDYIPPMAFTESYVSKMTRAILTCQMNDTTNIIISKLYMTIKGQPRTYYMGIRGKLVWSDPMEHGHDALTKTNPLGMDLLYDASHELYNNSRIVLEAGVALNNGRDFNADNLPSNEEFYNFWMNACKAIRNK